MNILNEIKFDDKGLVPAIAQDYKTGEVLMMAYMDREAVEKTLSSGKAHYFSLIYGSLGALMMFLLFVYYSALLFIVIAEFVACTLDVKGYR